ncbi:flavin monooxygenase-like, FAD/NAD(P)-binding domain protein [Tanacetum coccineum]
MGFSDFSLEDKTYGDPRMFPGHEEVLKFLEDFANEFGVTKMIRFSSEVVRVENVDSKFVVEWRTMEAGSKEEVFDAVVVCNGHHTEPRVADDIPGIEEWSRVQEHSHNYRVPEPYRDQVVVVIGNGPSALDISREIATVSKEVHLSSRSSNVKISGLDGHDNMWQHSKINRVFEDGTIVFQDNQSIKADAILHCTGYKFHFPFLRTNGMLQSKLVSLVLSKKTLLPSEDEMLANISQHYREMEENGIPKHHTHSLRLQFEYVDWLAAQVGLPIEDRLKEICRSLFQLWVARPNGFRDTFESECT